MNGRARTEAKAEVGSRCVSPVIGPAYGFVMVKSLTMPSVLCAKRMP